MGGPFDWVWQRREPALLALLSVPLIVALAALAYRSTLYVPINYNEGWNAFHAAAAISGGVLYPPPGALITNNYPPLSFFLVGSVARLTGDAVFAGRFLSWLAFLGVAGLVWTVLRQAGNDALAALFGALFFLAYSVVHFSDYVGMDDPQWLAHSVMMLGLFAYFRAPEERAASVTAGVLMAVALFVKHNIVALPLAFLLWLAVFDRRAAVRFAVAGIATGLAGLALCAALFGMDFFRGLLAPRAYSRLNVYRGGLVHLSQMQIPIAIAILAAITLRDRYFKLFFLYFALAMILGMVQLAGAGVSYNAMFEAVIALSLCLGHRVGRWRGHPFRLWAVAACAGALLLATGLDATQRVFLVEPWLQDQKTQQASTLQAVRLLAAPPGRALCERIVFCYWAHKDFELDPFNYNQGIRAGLSDADAVVQRIESGVYSAVQILPGPSAIALPGKAREALMEHYHMGPPLEPGSPAGVLYFR